MERHERGIADGKLGAAESGRFVPFAGGAGVGGRDRRRVSARSRCRGQAMRSGGWCYGRWMARPSASKADWDGRPDGAALRAGDAAGSRRRGRSTLKDEELIYIRLNARTHTPFGLGRLEVAFETINAFLSAHRYASRLASNSVVQYALWLKDLSPAASRAADPVVAGRDRGDRQGADTFGGE